MECPNPKRSKAALSALQLKLDMSEFLSALVLVFPGGGEWLGTLERSPFLSCASSMKG